MHENSAAPIEHEVNRAYCEALGEFSRLRWRHRPERASPSTRTSASRSRASPVQVRCG